MTTLLFAVALGFSGSGVSNIQDSGPESQYSQIRKAAVSAGYDLLAPDNTARGFKLSLVEVATSHPAKAVHMRFVNEQTTIAFDIFQAPASGEDARSHMKQVIQGGFFECEIAQFETFVALRVDAVDVALVGGLISEPSAKELIKRMHKVSAQ